jgi:hypothetical protein
MDDAVEGSCVLMISADEDYGHRKRIEQLLAIVNDELGWSVQANATKGGEEKVVVKAAGALLRRLRSWLTSAGGWRADFHFRVKDEAGRRMPRGGASGAGLQGGGRARRGVQHPTRIGGHGHLAHLGIPFLFEAGDAVLVLMWR